MLKNEANAAEALKLFELALSRPSDDQTKMTTHLCYGITLVLKSYQIHGAQSVLSMAREHFLEALSLAREGDVKEFCLVYSALCLVGVGKLEMGVKTLCQAAKTSTGPSQLNRTLAHIYSQWGLHRIALFFGLRAHRINQALAA
jgi:hypothetical protein